MSTLLMYPSGYKVGKIYSQIPTDGTGDFTFVRAGEKTRINSSGLIETIGANVPPIDYVDGTCPVLNLEPQSTNLALYSEDFSNTVWLKSDVSILNNQIIAPDGTISADKITEGLNLTNQSVRQTQGVLIDATSYTISIFAKKSEVTSLILRLQGSVSRQATFDLVNGTSLDGVSSTSTIKHIGNDWYYCTMTALSVGTSSRLDILLGSGFYQGDGTSGIYIWGAQLEEGTTPTSYIPTTTTTVTRVADVVTDAGDVNTFNSEEGVLFVEMAALADDNSQKHISISDGTISNTMNLFYGFYGSGKIYFQVIVNNVVTGGLLSGTLSVTDLNKIACVYKENRFELWINGIKKTEDKSGITFPINTLSKLSLAQNNDTLPLYGKVKQLKVFKTALTDAELETLTT